MYLVNLTPEIERWVRENCPQLDCEGRDEMCRFIHDSMDSDTQPIVENYCCQLSSMMAEKVEELEKNED